MLYFAYGSNLSWPQMRERCPSVQFVSVAKLPGYRYAFTRWASTRRCGVMDVVRDPDSDVWGVVFHIEERDLPNLDSKEGYLPGRAVNAYRRFDCQVLQQGDSLRPLAVFTYEVVDKADRHIPPNDEYKDLVLSGAKHWRLPDFYIRQLEGIEVS